MTNASIKAAFERMWQHISAALDHKVANIPSLPESSESHNGMFLRVVNGAPTWSNVPNAEEASF